jgi:Flp pilus assembly CpaE family ATPase
VAAIVLVSAKGSPGVTTAATALTAAGAASGRALLAELDPAGGSVQVLASGPASWGLLDAAGRLRREAGPDPVLANVTELPAGVPTLLAPTAGHTAESVIGSVTDRWIPSLRAAAPDVVIDAGRWEPSQRTAHRIAGADLVGVVCRPTVGGIEAARLMLDRLRSAARAPVAVVVVGHKPYSPDEIAAHLDVPLGGTLAWDPRAVAALWLGGAAPRWRRSSLGRSAAATGAQLTELAHRASARSADHSPRPEQAHRPAHAAHAPAGPLPPPPFAPSAGAAGTSP